MSIPLVSVADDEVAHYRDRAITDYAVPGFQVFVAYTPEGVKRMESEFIQRILALSSKTPAKVKSKLREEIRSNRHLNAAIKNNLILNLNHR